MRLSLATRIFLGYAVVLVTFGAVSIFSVAQMHKNQQEIRLVSQGYLHLAQDAAALDTFHGNRQRDTERLLAEKSPDTRRALIRLSRLYFPTVTRDRLTGAIQRLSEVETFAPASETSFVRDLHTRLSDLTGRYQSYERAWNNVFGEDPATVSDTHATSELRATEGAIAGDIRYLRAALENRIRERVDQAERRERQSGVLIIGLSVLAIGVGLLVTFISARTLRPVRALTASVSRMERGDYSAQLGLKGEDEISALAREFDALARTLKEREAQLKEKQEALLRAEQLAAVGRISAQVAHEVRNPLSSIGLNVEMLEDALAAASFEDLGQAREARDLLAATLREVDRLTEITEQYLRMARLPQPQLVPEDVNAVVARVLDFSREELSRAHVEVEQRLAPEGPRALADEGQLRQVFLNLLRNSREAMNGGGRLTIETRQVDSEVELVVRDTGRGMSGEVQQRIFEPFFSTKSNGTGLGLALSRQILQAHGGSIECESAPGNGTTFTIRLPRA